MNRQKTCSLPIEPMWMKDPNSPRSFLYMYVDLNEREIKDSDGFISYPGLHNVYQNVLARNSFRTFSDVTNFTHASYSRWYSNLVFYQ